MNENVTPGRLYLARTKYNQNGSQTLGQVSRDTGIDKTLIGEYDRKRVIGKVGKLSAKKFTDETIANRTAKTK